MHRRKKILWLVSWYPNKNDLFDGDFIQRHAKAAAIYNDIHVIYVTEAEIESSVEEEIVRTSGLVEQKIYLKKSTGLLSKFKKHLKWRSNFINAVKRYIDQHGKPDCVHVHVPWKAGLIALELKKRWGLNYFVTEHWGIFNDVVEDNFYTKSIFVRNTINKIFLESKAFISVSKYLAEGVKKIGIEKDYTVLPNVVDTSLFHHSDSKHEVFTFIHVSNMVPLKNVDGILTAISDFLKEDHPKAFQVIFVGNKNDHYPSKAKKLGISEYITFKGEIPYTNVAVEMQKAHCFILNSNIENSPCVIGEALCCGVPVIATRVGGVPELVDESNSVLINPNDSLALSEAMRKMINDYPNYDQKKISAEAQKSFSFESVGKTLNDIYDQYCKLSY